DGRLGSVPAADARQAAAGRAGDRLLLHHRCAQSRDQRPHPRTGPGGRAPEEPAMTAKPRVVLIALDACDPRTAQDLARAGRMPVLRDILRRGARSAVRNPPGLFVGGLWPSFATGLRPDRHRLHCWDEIDVASYERRLTSPRQRQGRSFWRRLGAAGRQYAVIDVPHTVVEPAHGGVEIAAWGCHDRHLGFQSWPAGEAQGLEREFGLHPVLGLDAYSERSFAPD